MVYYINMNNKQTTMKKATQRPSVQTRYAEQAKRDRRAAALERREQLAAGEATELQVRKALYSNAGL